MFYFFALLVSPAVAAPDSLPVALEMARRALTARDDVAAGESLRAAEGAVGASSLLVPAKEIARLHYYTGVRAWRGGLQSQGMSAWRRMWRVGGWDPEDDGLLDDEGMAVLRALRAEGGGDEVRVEVAGDARGALVLLDGSRLGGRTSTAAGAHLVQIRCPDGSVTSSWSLVSDSLILPVSCGQHQVKKGVAGANDAILAEGVDEDLAQLALFGAYSADATLRLVQLPPAPEPARPKDGAPEEAPADAHGRSAQAPPEGWECEDTTIYTDDFSALAFRWAGDLGLEVEGNGARVTEAGSRSVPGADGDVRIRLEGRGAFGIRLGVDRPGGGRAAVRFTNGALALVDLPDTVVVSRDVPGDGVHELEVGLRGSRVTVRLDGALFLGGAIAGPLMGVAGVEAEAGAWLGRIAVCR